MLDQQSIDGLRKTTVPPQRLFIAGDWTEAADAATMDVVSPIDGIHLTTLAAASAGDVDRAVRAARRAFDTGGWSKAAPVMRKKVLHKVADLIEAHALELAVLGVRDNGTEIGMAFKAEPGSAAATFR